MGLKSQKKQAMALVLILVILASLTVVIAGSLKVITSFNPNYSINRNKELSSKASGSFLCYKDEKGDLFYSRVDYNPDGTSNIKDGKVRECEFEIPKGTSGYHVYIIGKGGDGSDSKYTLSQSEPEPKSLLLTDNNTQTDEILNHFFKVSIAATPKCKNQTKSQESIEQLKLDPNLTEDQMGLKDFYNYLKQNNNKKLNNLLSIKPEGYNCCNIYNIYTYGICSDAVKSIAPDSWKYELKIKIKDKEKTISINPANNNKISEEINSFLNDKDMKYSYEISKPVFKVNIGHAGKPGYVKKINIDSSIYGKNGDNKITISKNDIADNTNSTTKFTYYVRTSSKGYQAITETAINGENGTMDNEKQLDNLNLISSEDGAFPTDFPVPSTMKFAETKYPGYIDANGSAHPATYFGASGAPGYLNPSGDDMPSIAKCNTTQLVINDHGKRTIERLPSENSIKNCDAEKSVNGSKGAPGAILINW